MGKLDLIRVTRDDVSEKTVPFEHTATFRVRRYECDANGHLNYANYLRYALETSAEALAAAGHGPKGLAAMERAWRVRDLFIEYLRPREFGDTVQVTASVTGLLSDAALWSYELRESGSDRVCARSRAVFAFLDTAAGKPSPIPDELVEILRPPDRRGGSSTQIDFPPSPPQPPGTFSDSWEVRWTDVGQDLGLRTAVYLDYLSNFVSRAAAACGWSFRRRGEEQSSWFIRRQWLRIFEPAVLGSQLRFTTWISDIRRATVMRHLTIHHEGADVLGAQAHTLWVCVDPLSGRPTRIPPGFARDFASQISRE